MTTTKIYKARVKTKKKSGRNNTPAKQRKFKQIPANEYDVEDINHYDRDMLKKIVVFLDTQNNKILKSIFDVERKNQIIEDENEILKKRINELEQ